MEHRYVINVCLTAKLLLLKRHQEKIGILYLDLDLPYYDTNNGKRRNDYRDNYSN